MQRARHFLRKAFAGWLALEAAVGLAIAIGFALDGQYTAAAVLLVLVALFGVVSWRVALRRARDRRDTA